MDEARWDSFSVFHNNALGTNFLRVIVCVLQEPITLTCCSAICRIRPRMCVCVCVSVSAPSVLQRRQMGKFCLQSSSSVSRGNVIRTKLV